MNEIRNDVPWEILESYLKYNQGNNKLLLPFYFRLV